VQSENARRYDQVWKHAALQEPCIWPSWEIIAWFQGRRCLEIGAGNYPKIPLASGVFLDLSEVAASNLNTRGLNACVGSAEDFPLADGSFDLVVAWEVLEHIQEHKKTVSEIARVLRRGGAFLLSVPLHQDRFGPLDHAAGHKRRYEPRELAAILEGNRFHIIKFRCPQLVKRLERVPGFKWLVNRTYSCPAHTSYFGLPRPILNLVVRAGALLLRASSGHWRTGPLQDLEGETEINVLCERRD